MFFTKYFFLAKKNRFRFFEVFSELRRSYELRFGQRASLIKCYLNFEKSYVDFQYFGLSLPKTMKFGPKSIEKRAKLARILVDFVV